jgi:acetyl esterase
MKIPICLLPAVGFVFAATLCSGFAKTTKLDLPSARAEVYKKASSDDLYLYIFEPEGHDAAKDKLPAIVFFFGGGWTSGTPTQFEQHSRYLASRGMVAICADYRVNSRQKTSPKECVADGKSAIRWVRANAERLGIDPNRIAAGGGSAGGHVAATTGMVDGLDDPADKNASVSSKANALVLFNPVYENGPKGYGHSRVKEWFPQISPAHNISKDDPPTIVFLGTKDNLIPVTTAEKFKADMEDAGLKSELHLYEGQQHGFFNEHKGGTENFLDTLRKTDAFLVGLGYLEGTADEASLKSVSKN